jgi:hypothetical protein
VRAIDDPRHLGSNQVSRVIDGSIVGWRWSSLSSIIPRPGVVIGTLLGTAVAVALAELYSEIVGAEVGTGRRIDRPHACEIWTDAAAVAFGISFPAAFFLVAAPGAIQIDTAFELASGPGSA